MAIQLFKELIDENGHLEIPEGVRKILPNTLMNCEKITSVSIPRSVTIIGACSFLGCKNLRRVELREGLRTIDVAAFMGCSNLESIVILEGVRIIAHDAFRGCTGLTRIVLPSSVTVIGQGAFEGCSCLNDDDEPDGTEDYGVGLVDVTKNSDEYILKILSQVNECQDTYLDEDWRDWCERMARLYGCKVVLHRESGVYESDIHDEDTRLFELDGNSVKETPLSGFPYGDLVQKAGSNSQPENSDIPF